MKICSVIVSLLAAVSISGSVLAQGPPPIGPPQMANRQDSVTHARVLRIGPSDSMSIVSYMSGTMTLIASMPPNVDVATVDIYADGKVIQSFSKKPYFAKFDTTTLTNGEHVIKAVAKNAGGTETWSASVKVSVTNNTGQQAAPPNVVVPPKAPISAPIAGAPSTGETALSETYKSKAYGFTIKYPKGWVVLDATSKLTKKDEFKLWLMFAAKPMKTASIVVNLRRTPLKKGSTADTFMQYNSYVQSWQRKNIGDSEAFATTSGSAETKRVMHRLIIIKNSSAWMFNCIDKSGLSPEKSQAIFDAMVNSFSLP